MTYEASIKHADSSRSSDFSWILLTGLDERQVSIGKLSVSLKGLLTPKCLERNHETLERVLEC